MPHAERVGRTTGSSYDAFLSYAPTQILYGLRPGHRLHTGRQCAARGTPGEDGRPGSGTLDVYDLAPDRLVAVACATAGRDLTPDEWRQFVNDAVPDDLRCARP